MTDINTNLRAKLIAKEIVNRQLIRNGIKIAKMDNNDYTCVFNEFWSANGPDIRLEAARQLAFIRSYDKSEG